MADEPKKDERREKERADREARRNKENAERETRRNKENAEREARRSKEQAAREKGQRQTKGATQTQAAKEEAKSYDINTKGMSTREIKGAVAEAKKVEEDMLKFIEKSLGNFLTKKGDSAKPSTIPATTSSRITEDRPTPFAPVSGGKGRGKGGSDIPAPPSEGIYILGAENGEIKWFETYSCTNQQAS